MRPLSIKINGIGFDEFIAFQTIVKTTSPPSYELGYACDNKHIDTLSHFILRKTEQMGLGGDHIRFSHQFSLELSNGFS